MTRHELSGAWLAFVRDKTFANMLSSIREATLSAPMLLCVSLSYAGLQVHDMTEKLAQFTDIRAALVVGGMSLAIQASTLRSRPEIVIGTPVSLSLFSHKPQGCKCHCPAFMCGL